MNLAARFPYNAATAERHDACLYVHRVVGEMFDRLCAKRGSNTVAIDRERRESQKNYRCHRRMTCSTHPFDRNAKRR